MFHDLTPPFTSFMFHDLTPSVLTPSVLFMT